MADQPPVHDDRFKAEMPQIPGIDPGSSGKRPGGFPAPLLVIGGLIAVVLAVVIIGRIVSRSHRNANAADPSAQVEVPAPDLGNPPPQVPPANRGIATIDELAKPWSSVQFDYRDPLSGERVPALLLRLPAGSAMQPGGYWAMNLKAPYNNCEVEFVADLEKLKTDYGFRTARHPMVGNPCSRTIFDPLKMTNLPGNIWVRGAIVQGSDLRPPLGIEIKIEGKNIFAVRME
jgi:hypothetical protein